MVIPYAKESPFKRPMNEAFEKMRSFGILSDILQQYEPVKDESCGNPKVREHYPLMSGTTQISKQQFVSTRYPSAINISLYP